MYDQLMTRKYGHRAERERKNNWVANGERLIIIDNSHQSLIMRPKGTQFNKGGSILIMYFNRLPIGFH